MKPGIYPSLSREEYERIDAVNLSTLKHMKKSAAHYRAALLGKDNDTDAKKLGRAVHLAVFEPERFSRTVVVWTGKVRNGKVWDEFREKHAGREILTENGYDEAVTIQKAVHADPIAKEMLSGGTGEVTLVWKMGDVLCKGRLDFIGKNAIPDLKTANDASPEGFSRAAWDYGYHIQAAWYGDAHTLLSGERKPFYNIAVESSEPYIVQPYRVPEAMIREGRRQYTEWLEKLIFCRSQNWWPGYADQVLDLTPPKWVTLPEEQIAPAERAG